MAVIGHQDIAGLLRRAFGAGRNSGRTLLGGRKLTARTAVLCVEIVLLAILGVLLGLISLSFLAPLSLPQIDVVATAPIEQQTGSTEVKSPFPATALSAAPLGAAPIVAETTLDLTLTGVWPNPDGGSAIIRTPDGDENRFAVGDAIVQGVTLSAVYPDQVTLNRGGVREALRFESKLSPEKQTIPLLPINEQMLTVTPEMIGKLASVVRLAPTMDANGGLAIEIHAARDRRTFAALGLQNGDRLVSVNGTPSPTNPAALGELLSDMQQRDAATLVVERDGEELPIYISMDQLGYD